MKSHEHYVKFLGTGDGNGDAFFCGGAPERLERDPQEVGIELRYVTKAQKKSKTYIDNHAMTPLRGCRMLDEDRTCTWGGGTCPVAGIVHLDALRERQRMLFKLKRIA